jgi:DNA-binding transcriptional ArsR family regulator
MPASHAAKALGRSVLVFAALGDATRLAVVERLCDHGPASVTTLSEGAEVSRQAISRHLQVLEEAGLVTNKRVGRESIWELRPERLDDARRALDLISREWDARIERLARLVED